MSTDKPVRQIDSMAWEQGKSVLSLADIGNMLGHLSVECKLTSARAKSKVRTSSYLARLVTDRAILKMLCQPKG